MTKVAHPKVIQRARELWSKELNRHEVRVSRILKEFELEEIGVDQPLKNRSFKREHAFTCRVTENWMIWDFAVRRGGRTIYIELQDPSHNLPARRIVDANKVKAAKRVRVQVIPIWYSDMERNNDDAPIQKKIKDALDGKGLRTRFRRFVSPEALGKK